MSYMEELWDTWKASEGFSVARETAVVEGRIDSALELAFCSGALMGIRASADAQKRGFAERDAKLAKLNKEK